MMYPSIRSAAPLALVVSLAACGGLDKAEFTVAGTVTGLVYDGLILSNGGARLEVAPPAMAGNVAKFAFPDKLEYGDAYDVRVAQSPAHQTCAPVIPEGGTRLNNADTAGRLERIDVAIGCEVNRFSIGGTITGLTGAGLVLINGSTGGAYAAVPSSPTAPIVYEMPAAVAYNVTYGVTISAQPIGQVCTVINPVGTMQDAKIANIDVTCVST